MFTESLKKQVEKSKLCAKNAIVEPLFSVEQSERQIFQRILGHPEIVGSQRWQNATDGVCKICNKYCYAIFTWNYDVQNDVELRFEHFKQSLSRPVSFGELDCPYPILVVNGQLQKMVPLSEFVERLKAGRR